MQQNTRKYIYIYIYFKNIFTKKIFYNPNQTKPSLRLLKTPKSDLTHDSPKVVVVDDMP